MRHELAHRHSGDSRWMVAFALIRSVNWWNTFVHQLVLGWSDAREELCDVHGADVSYSRA